MIRHLGQTPSTLQLRGREDTEILVPGTVKGLTCQTRVQEDGAQTGLLGKTDQ